MYNLFEDLDYARGRLIGSVVSDHDNNVVYCENIDRDGKVSCTVYDQFSSVPRQMVYDINNLRCFELPPLGMSNTNRGALYIYKLPKRRPFRQGLTRENVCIVSIGHVNPRLLSLYEFFTQPFKNIYPPFEVALGVTRQNNISVGFNRNMAVYCPPDNKGTRLFYKTNHCGFYTDQGVKLKPEFSFLREVFIEQNFGVV